MDKTYQPQKVEKKIYQMWEKGGYFTPKIDPKKKPFTIIMPPPNANAPLHIGHGLVKTVEDIMIRYHRMKGEPTLWLPGADHAGILTQVTFERKLAKERKTRYDLGREKFFSEIMKFTLNNKRTMESQIKALGASCDWTRNSFTLDLKFNRPVYTTFKKLYDEGLIYRDERMINWCPRCQTALSDLEVKHNETKSKLWFIRYPLKAGKKFITVATTRPETMLGDTAIAVHPGDKRYKNLVGKTAILPLMDREIPIIADKLVDPDFGTGAVKVTPAHDPVDFELGQQHKLAIIKVIDFDDKITKEAGDYAGLEIKEAREKVLTDLKKLQLLEKEEDYTHSVGFCERCKTIIEPLVSKQWFIKIASLAKPAIEVVEEGKIKIIPKRFEKIYLNWMKNVRDWCISRQLWWGHQLPVWYCGSQNLSPLQKQMNKLSETKGCNETIVSILPPKKCPKCGSQNLIRDPDTFDAWFSSGQWPFTTLDWPKKTDDFNYFYPTSVMETGYEILFLWVSRMIMLGLYTTKKAPFATVYLHGMVRDAFGKKMSKSRPETAIDPMETVEKYGADALRIALIIGNTPGTDSSLSDDKIKGMRNFANKIWNMGRFILMNIETSKKKVPYYDSKMDSKLTKEDKEIIKDLKKLIKDTTKLIEKYRFDLAAEGIYHFLWHRFADEYIEYSKKRIKKNDIVVLAVLRHVYLNCLKLLHPFMPFVTEQVWQLARTKNKEQRTKIFMEEALIISKWPK